MLISIAMETTGFPETAYEQEILELAIVNEDGETLFFKRIKPSFRVSWKAASEKHGLTYNLLRSEKELDAYREEILDILNRADRIIGYNIFRFDIQMLLEVQLFTSKEHLVCDLKIPFTEIFKEKSRSKEYKYKSPTRLSFVQYYGYLTTGFESSLEKAQGQLYAYKEMIEEQGEDLKLVWRPFFISYKKPQKDSQNSRQIEAENTNSNASYLLTIFAIFFLIILFQLLS